MIHRLQFEHWVPVPIEKVFVFFSNPNNLPRIMPPATATKLIELKLVPPPASIEFSPVANRDSLAGVGSEIVTSFRLLPFLPFRAKWVALIIEFEGNHHFADVQKKGPFKRFKHRHEFSEEIRNAKTGTIVRDVIEYEVGFGVAGELAQALLVAPSLKRTFEYRQHILEKMLV